MTKYNTLVNIHDFLVTEEQFNKFIRNNPQNAVIENNDAMTNSYVMLDPAGRFFNNQNCKYVYSTSILNKNIKTCYNHMNYNYKKFKNRQGDYYLNQKKTETEEN